MTRFLLATDSVHTTAAACDYLDGRLRGDDVVDVLTVREPGAAPRDGDDALNVATVRLAGGASVETTVRESDPTDAILEAVDEEDVDEVLVGARAATSGADAAVGETTRTLLAEVTVPVVVVPVPRLGCSSGRTQYG